MSCKLDLNMTVLNVRAGTDNGGVTRQIYFWSGNDPALLSLHVSRLTLFLELKKIYTNAPQKTTAEIPLK